MERKRAVPNVIRRPTCEKHVPSNIQVFVKANIGQNFEPNYAVQPEGLNAYKFTIMEFNAASHFTCLQYKAFLFTEICHHPREMAYGIQRMRF
jgi:hypothetical protein